jgi:hypothetical protein
MTIREKLADLRFLVSKYKDTHTGSLFFFTEIKMKFVQILGFPKDPAQVRWLKLEQKLIKEEIRRCDVFSDRVSLREDLRQLEEDLNAAIKS